MRSLLRTTLYGLLFPIACMAQNDQIPLVVRQAFDRIQPDTEVHWDLENAIITQPQDKTTNRNPFFIGRYKENDHVAGHVFDKNGNFIRKDVRIRPTELPVLTQIYVHQEHQHPISEAHRWETREGTIQYCIFLGEEKYLFDEYGGNLGRPDL